VKIWWLWRLKPHPKKLLYRDLELPISYLAADRLDPEETDPASRLTGASMSHSYRPRLIDERPTLGTLLEHLERELGQRKIQTDGFVRIEAVGAMRTLKIDLTTIVGRGRTTKRIYWLTPPVEQFLDAKKHLPDDTLRYGAPALDRERRYTYWINRDVFEASGEFLGGSLEATHRVINVQDTQKAIDLMQEEGETNEVGNLILVALDAYLERGSPDSRFNPGGNPSGTGRDGCVRWKAR